MPAGLGEACQLANKVITKGILKLFDNKRQVLGHILEVEMPKHAFALGDRDRMAHYMADHDSYQAYYVAASGDVAWPGQLQVTSVECLRLAQDANRSAKIETWHVGSFAVRNLCGELGSL